MTPLRSLGNPDISPFDDVFASTKDLPVAEAAATSLTSVHFDGTNDYLDGTEGTYTDLNFPGDFTIQNRQAKCIEYIKERVGDQKVLVITYDHYSPSIELGDTRK